MTRALSLRQAQDRLWRFSAYGLATLIHVPLIIAAHQFAETVSASEPVDSVITLLDAPAVDRTIVVPPSLQRTATVVDTLERGTATAVTAEPAAASVAAASLVPAGTPTAQTSVVPVRTLETAAVVPSREAATVPPVASTNTVAEVEPATANTSIDLAAVSSEIVAASVPSVALDGSVRSEPAPARPSIAPNIALAAPGVAPAIAPALASAASPAPTRGPNAPVRGRSVAVDLAPARSGSPTAAVASSLEPVVASASPVASTTPSARSASAAQPAASAAASTGSTPSSAAAVSAPRAPPRISIPARPVVGRSASVGAVPAATTTRPATAKIAALPSAVTSSAPLTVAPSRTLSPTPARTADGAASPEPAGPNTAGSRSALARFVQGYEGGGCFAALPMGSSGSDFAVSGFSRDETALGAFNDALGRTLGTRAAGQKVSDAQCSALAFARSQPRYPDFPVRLSLTPDRIASGGTIRGTILGTGQAPVTLLVLDDEGRIQDATFLLTASDDGSLFFETPLSLTGEPVPTVQLFVVLSGDGPTAAMRPPVPVEARRYFQEIARLASEAGAALDVAIGAFTVDRRLAGPAP